MSKKQPERILKAFAEFMPYYFKFINSALHKISYNNINFNENQIKVMMVIKQVTKLTPTEISSILNIQKGSLTTIIKSLLKIGYIKKENVEKDERKYYLSLTEEGEKFVIENQEKNIRNFNRLFADMSDDECEKVIIGYQTLTKYFQSFNKR